jgi:hypothetical protein
MRLRERRGLDESSRITARSEATERGDGRNETKDEAQRTKSLKALHAAVQAGRCKLNFMSILVGASRRSRCNEGVA